MNLFQGGFYHLYW